jgi:transcriptional regulator with XRE-family HTH domain
VPPSAGLRCRSLGPARGLPRDGGRLSVFDEASSQRQRLASALRELRQAIGISGAEFARRVGWAQSKVSRIETGEQLPSADDLDRWLAETAAGTEQRADLRGLLGQAADEAVAWRRYLRRGLVALQEDVAALEASSGVLRYYHPTLVPGLVQTPGYAKAVYEAMHPEGRADISGAIAARMNRQAILYDEAKRIEFVVGEAALRWWFPPTAAMLGQLDRLAQVAALPNVALGILPLGPTPMWRSHHFTVYDERPGGPLVHIELLAGGRNFRDPDDVARYVEAFERLHSAAVTGKAAQQLLKRVTADLRA